MDYIVYLLTLRLAFIITVVTMIMYSSDRLHHDLGDHFYSGYYDHVFMYLPFIAIFRSFYSGDYEYVFVYLLFYSGDYDYVLVFLSFTLQCAP